MTNEFIIESNKLIAEFLGCKIEYDVADWNKHDDKSITEFWNDNNKTYVYTPKGQGLPWYKVKHRGNFYQLYTDFTFSKLKEEELEQGCTYNEKYYLVKDLKFHSSWDWLMPVIEKIETLNYSVNITQNICTIKACIMGDRTVRAHQTGNYKTPDTKLYNTWLAVVEFIEWYNNQKNLA